MAQQPVRRPISKKQHAEMMRRRRITTVCVIVCLILVIIICIINGVVNHKEAKKKAAEEAKQQSTKTVTEQVTEPETYEMDIIFDVDDTYKSKHKYCVGVNRKMNVVTVYQKGDDGEYTEAVKAFVCSCGKEGNETPVGTYKTRDKYDWLKMVDGTYGQYTLRFNDKIWFHSVPYNTKSKGDLEYDEYNKLGEGASLGCVRLSVADAKWLYDNLDWNTMVFIYDSDVPGALGKPKATKIDTNSKNKGWDPTDPDPSNPWKSKK